MKKFNSVLSKTFIVIMAIITLFPFVYMILASLMTYQEATSIPPTLVPEKFQWKCSTNSFHTSAAKVRIFESRSNPIFFVDVKFHSPYESHQIFP